MAHRIVDVSSNQAHPIDWVKVKASGIDAAFIKATEGIGYSNPFFDADVAEAQAAGLQVAGYHFRGAGLASTEAAFFQRVAGPHAKILDVETSQDATWIEVFLAALPVPAQQQMTYGSQSTLPITINRGLIWIADYTANPGRGECWQFTNKGQVPGISGNVDISMWMGTENQWQGFFELAPSSNPGGGGVSTIVGMAPTPSGSGYYLVGSDGGVFCYGDAHFMGSLGGKGVTDIVGIAVHPTNQGYWLAGADGGVFAFGHAPFKGSLGNTPLTSPVVSISATPSGNGYWLAAKSGLFAFGDAKFLGHP